MAPVFQSPALRHVRGLNVDQMDAAESVGCAPKQKNAANLDSAPPMAKAEEGQSLRLVPMTALA